MKKYLITGFSGFVASHFVEFLYKQGTKCEIYGLDIRTPSFDFTVFSDVIKTHFSIVDLMDGNSLKNILDEFKPDYILHLAAFSSVAYSWKHPADSFKNNSNIFLNLIEAVLATKPDCRILSVGSSEEYGDVNHSDLPLRESQSVNPINPYAVARVSQELMSKVYVNAFDLQIILTRSFNHIGPRQDDRFVIPSFINRILEVKVSGKRRGIIETGDIEIVRDFVDVRDVVEAYYMLLERGTAGEIYNICSGKAIRLKEIIEMIANDVGVEIDTVLNPEFVRPNDNREIVGSSFKIETEIGWKPKRQIKDTIHDMVVERKSK